MLRGRLLSTVVAALATVWFAAPAAGAPRVISPPAGDAVPGEVLVGYKASAEASARSRARSSAGVTRERALRIRDVQLVRTKSGTTVQQAIRALERDPAVRYAEPNRIRRASATTPNDPLFGELWGLNNTGQTIEGLVGVADKDIDAPEAWDVSVGTDVLVAVVDEGVDYTHPDLAPNIFVNGPEAVGTSGVDDDANGYVDDVHGIDTFDGDSDPRDFGGHGTHVAGTIAAAGNNGIGLAGVAWRARILPVRVLGPGGGDDASVAEGFDYAGDMGARVVNASLGGPGSSQTMQQAIAGHPSTLFVVAAGNEGENVDAVLGGSFPCNYPDGHLICVAATDNSDNLADFSNYGTTSVDLAAPGVGIRSAAPDRSRVVFRDDFEQNNFTSVWFPNRPVTSAPATWGRDSEFDNGGSFSAGDSPGPNYANNVEHYIDLVNPINLQGEAGCALSFDLRLASEFEADYFTVWAAYDGGGFENLDAFSGFTVGGAFVPVEIPLDPDADQVNISFGFESNLVITNEGANVDNVTVACLDDRYDPLPTQFLDGTSMATPHVAGAAAVLFARRPSATVAQVRGALLANGDPLSNSPGHTNTNRTVTDRRLNLNTTILDPVFGTDLPPVAETGGASGVTSSEVTIAGTVAARGTFTSYTVEYGPSPAYGSATTAKDVGSGTSTVPVTETLTGLAPLTTYHYRVVALRGAERFAGQDRTFTTTAPVAPPPGPPPVPPASTAPPTVPPPPPADPRAALRKGAKVKCQRRRGRARCKVTAAKVATKASLKLKRKSRTLAKGSGKPGRTIRLKGRVPRGRLTAVLTLRDAAGNSVKIRFKIRLR